MKVLVIYGGEGLTDEWKVSIASGETVMGALRTAGFEPVPFCLTDENQAELESAVKEVDVIFPLVHGHFGEDGKLQILLEKWGRPFVGSSSSACALSFDKRKAKLKLTTEGIVVPASLPWGKLDFPLIVKPRLGGSSLGVKWIRGRLDFEKVDWEKWRTRYGEPLVEPMLAGYEISVAILVDEVLPIVEIETPKDRDFDFDAKYLTVVTESIPPRNLTASMEERARKTALEVHKILGLREWSRIDMMVVNGQMVVLEANTVPGMTGTSLYPKMAKAAGYELPELVRKLVEECVKFEVK